MDEINKAMNGIKQVDPYLGKFYNWLLTIPFFRIKILWQILIGLTVVMIPIQSLWSLINVVARILFLQWSIGGIIIGAATILATVFLAKYFLFDNESEFRLSGLGLWSKLLLLCTFGGRLLDGLVTLFSYISFGRIISHVISLALFIAFSYVAVFAARYFTDVIIHDNTPYTEDIVIEK